MVSATVPSRSTSATVSIGAKRRPCAVLITSPSTCGKTASGLPTRKSATRPIGRSLIVARRPTSSEMNPSVNAMLGGTNSLGRRRERQRAPHPGAVPQLPLREQRARPSTRRSSRAATL